ncbi:hypothetical protein GQ44DRAFT_759712 [Phaeosphaeriaceae sp. PMI808]|nr:hypothetical protein GQ44DRAFT_759712 [Phaeosphaeriaceae sp. PMI808]
MTNFAQLILLFALAGLLLTKVKVPFDSLTVAWMADRSDRKQLKLQSSLVLPVDPIFAMANIPTPHGGSRRPLRPFLPVNRDAFRNDIASPAVPAKRARASAACSACRVRKSKCSTERPKCSECTSRNTACEYTETQNQSVRRNYEMLRNEQNKYEKSFNMLMTMPEKDSFDMLRRIRAGNDDGHIPICPPPRSPTSINTSLKDENQGEDYRALQRKNKDLEKKAQNLADLYGLLQTKSEHVATEIFQRIREGMPLDDVPALTARLLNRRSPSPNQANWNILAPTSHYIEFQLVALHPNAYPALLPLDVASLDLRLLGISFLTFPRHEDQKESSKGTHTDPNTEHDRKLLPKPYSTNDQGTPHISTAQESPSQYADARLSRIDMKCWTNVAISDDLAAQALNLYLINDTPWLAYFNIDLFLEDLVNCQTRFCSRLLVNSVLAWACQTYAYYEPTAYFLASELLHEASQLYEAVRDVDCLQTLASTSLMCMAWTTLGKDKIGMKLLAENASMAERLHLYNVPADAPQRLLYLQDDSMITAVSAAAWGSFNLQMLMSMSFHSKPFAKLPPYVPMPGDSSTEGSFSRPLPPYQGPVYNFVCKFWSIAYEMNYQYFYKEVVLLADAENIFQKLLAWADGLHEGVKRKEHTTDGVTNLHIWFHTVVLDLFRPFADLKPQPKLTTFADNNATPAKVMEASINQLKRLIYNYRATSKSANYSVIWQSGVLHLLNYILHNYTSKEAHFYFLLCMRGYQNLARTIPGIGGVVQGVSAMAVRLGTILPKDALMLFEEIESEGKRIHDYTSTYPIDLYHSTADTDAATLEHLVHEFRTMENMESKNSKASEGRIGDSVALFTTLLDNEFDEVTTELPMQDATKGKDVVEGDSEGGRHNPCKCKD